MRKKHYLIPFLFLLFSCSDENAEQCKSSFQDKDTKLLAENFCQNAAKAGDADSQYFLGEILLEKGDIEQAKKYFEEAANQKNGKALFKIAQFYDKGGQLHLDLDSALFYYKQSCQAGEIKACEKVDSFERSKEAEAERIEKVRLDSEKKRLAEENARLLAEQKRQAEQQQQLLKEQKKLAESNQQMMKKLSDIADRQNISNSSAQNQTFSTIQINSKFYQGLASYQEENGLWGFINTQNQIVIPAQFARAGRFSKGRAAVQSTQNNLWGFIDRTGKYVIPPRYTCLGYFSEEGLAGVYEGGYISNGKCVGGKWGYINTAGNWVISPVLDHADRFSRGKAKVTFQGKTGFIDTKGNWVP
ncbi:WG repeat-containing protein [Avibacterium avium]|uniref:WG repeat-containing protein n=1 Tax=Avibacterium avium TaxID=751 RepID=UPI0039FBCFB6